VEESIVSLERMDRATATTLSELPVDTRTLDRDIPAIRLAARLCGATVAWNMTVGCAAVVTAVLTGSLALVGFGVNAVVDSSVSSLLVWRFRMQAVGGCDRALRAERIALHLAGIAFTVIATYLLVQASRSLLMGKHPDSSVFGIIEAVAAVLVLPYLAVSKYRLSRQLQSRALRADSLLTVSGVALAAVALTSLLLQRSLGWWWADSTGALLVAVLLAWQGYRSTVALKTSSPIR
jgi:divalent metal cation (Fe/Co/Zn/Cd) transporter